MGKRIICGIALLCLLFSGCEKKISDDEKMIQKIIQAVESDNSEVIYDMFAPIIKESDPNLKADIDEFVNYPEGKIENNIEIGLSERDTSNEKNGFKKKISVSHKVVTSDEEYVIQCVFCPEVYDEGYMGILSLGVQKYSELSKESPMAPAIRGAYTITPENREEIDKRVTEAKEIANNANE